MKAVARAIGVSRSNLWDRHHGRHQGRPIQYDKAGDEQLLQSVRKICEHRGSYGYRRMELTRFRGRLWACGRDRFGVFPLVGQG